MITITRLIRPLGAIAASAALLASTQTFAAAQSDIQCSQKLHSTLYGRSASQTELGIENPMSMVDDMLVDDEFKEKFGKFVNAHMNWVPADGRDNNPVYMAVTRYLFKPRQEHGFDGEYPWKNLFTEGYKTYGGGWNPQGTEDGQLGNEASGYFSDKGWKETYKGNEEDGIKIRTAYLIMNNQIGLNLEALTVNSLGGSGISARSNPATVCYQCHYATNFALDKVAEVLPMVDRANSDAQNFVETAYRNPDTGAAGKTQIIYGQPVSNLKELTAVLAELPEFYDNACSVAFEFVFGREERGSDREVFGPCIDKFKESGLITTAVRHFVESDYFCKVEG